jgi:hypothetical protein
VPAGAGSKGPASGPQLDLPPGAYKFLLKIPGKPAASDEINVAADETWGLLIGPGGALPPQMYRSSSHHKCECRRPRSWSELGQLCGCHTGACDV